MTRQGDLKVNVFLGKVKVQLGLQHHHHAHCQEHGLRAKGFTWQCETSKDSNHFPETSCATTPFYRKVNRRQVSIDRLMADLQPGGDPRDSGCKSMENGSRPCALNLQPSSGVPLVTERRMCSLCWLSHPAHGSRALGVAAELLLTSVRKHSF